MNKNKVTLRNSNRVYACEYILCLFWPLSRCQRYFSKLIAQHVKICYFFPPW